MKDDLKAESPHAIIEEAGMGFDPAAQSLDLSKEEKRRTTALLLAISAYKELIIKDAAYLREAHEIARRGDGDKPTPARIEEMVEAAIKFDQFIAQGAGATPGTSHAPEEASS